MADNAGAAARPGALVAFSHRGFGALWGSTVLFAFAQSLERVAVGWFVLEETGSAFLTALAFAARMAPNLFFGLVAGALADRYARSSVLRVAALAKASVLVATFALVSLAGGPVGPLLVLVALSGATMTLQNASFLSLIPELVGPARALNATSLANLGQRGTGIVGGLTAGFVIALLGAAEVFLIGAAVLLVASWSYRRVPSVAPPAAARRPLRTEIGDGLRLIVSVPIVAALLGLMVLVEIFGFSFQSLLPVLADDVLDVGPEGLGGLTAALSVGSLIGMGVLAGLGNYRRKGALLLGVVFCFGVLLVLLASSDRFVVALVVVAGVGAAAALVDTLEWVLLQTNVANELRGRAIGGWNAAIGVGWVGPIALGLVTEVWGVQVALAASGTALLCVALAATAVLPGLRRS